MSLVNKALKFFSAKILFLPKAAAFCLPLTTFCLLFSGCAPASRLTEDQFLVSKNRVFVNSKKADDSSVYEYLRQKPNNEVFGIFPLYLSIYNIAKQNPKESFEKWKQQNGVGEKILRALFSEKGIGRIENNYVKINEWLADIGEAPVVYDSTQTRLSRDELKSFYFNRGYFDAQVTSQSKFRMARAKTDYFITTKEPYTIDSLKTDIESMVIDTLYNQVTASSLVQPGERYLTDNFIKERKRLTEYFQGNGVYNFQENFVSYHVDTNLKKNKADVLLRIPNMTRETPKGTFSVPFRQFIVSQINVITDYSFENPDAPYKDSLTHQGINLFATSRIKYKPRVITDKIFIGKNELFDIETYNQTKNALRSLHLFQSANIQIEVDPDSTSVGIPALKANIYLMPVKSWSANISVEASRSTLLGFGSNINLSVNRNNAFGGGEIWGVTLRTTFGNQYSPSGNQSINTLFNAYEIGLSTNLSFPRFLLPFNTEGLIAKSMMPTTTLTLGGSIQKNIGLDRNYLNIGLDYQWEEFQTKLHKISLVKFAFAKNLNKLNYFRMYNNTSRDQALADYMTLHPEYYDPNIYSNASEMYNLMTIIYNDPSFRETNPSDYNAVADDIFQYERYTTDYFIPAIAYTFTYNNQRYNKEKAFTFFQGDISFAGNLFSLLGTTFNFPVETLASGDRTRTIFGVPFAQFFKVSLDFRKYWNLTPNSLIALRALGAATIPYGNSQQLPFNEAYFAGGVNYERGWLAYELGPGGVQQKTFSYNIGNIRLLASLEYRFMIYKELKGAIFFDAGNIWYTSQNMTADPLAVFNFGRFYKELGLNTGVGLRYDLNYFIIRLDLGLRMLDPSQPENSRWVLNQADFSNAVYNFAIAYPF